MSPNLEISEADKFAALPEEDRDKILAGMTEDQLKELAYSWKFWARPKQLRCFENDWNTFLYLCGRGFGKSRTAVQWVREKALTNPGCRIGIVGATAQVTNRTIVMDLLDICLPGEATHKRGDAIIKFSNGTTIFIWSADEPKRLRGSNHHFALADDIVAWRYAEAYHMLKLTLRSGVNPQMMITTSAAATPLILNIVSRGSEDENEIEKAVEEVNNNEFIQKGNLIIVRGTTFENSSLPAVTLEDYKQSYPEESIMGQQELYAKIVMKVEGALWERKWIQLYKKVSTDPETRGELLPEPTYKETVVAVDPAVSVNKNSDYTAIVVSSRGADGNFYVRYAKRFKTTPGAWARETIAVYHRFKADKIVVEKNNGGLLVLETLQNEKNFYIDGVKHDVDGKNLPIELIHAKEGKYVRATPIAFLYENKRVWHIETFSELEQQMLAFKGDPNGSDDLVDALVYSLLHLSGAKVSQAEQYLVGGERISNNLRFL